MKKFEVGKKYFCEYGEGFITEMEVIKRTPKTLIARVHKDEARRRINVDVKNGYESINYNEVLYFTTNKEGSSEEAKAARAKVIAEFEAKQKAKKTQKPKLVVIK